MLNVHREGHDHAVALQLMFPHRTTACAEQAIGHIVISPTQPHPLCMACLTEWQTRDDWATYLPSLTLYDPSPEQASMLALAAWRARHIG